ncbi:hypothetical protein BVRB_026230, partial [Beta vulgaris subsp. vulgaris]
LIQRNTTIAEIPEPKVDEKYVILLIRLIGCESFICRSIAHNLEQFCSQVDEILSARSFFQARQFLPSANKNIQACQILLKRCVKVVATNGSGICYCIDELSFVQSCENEFKNIIETDSKKIDFSQLPWPLPTDYQPISSSTLNKLGSLAACLHRCSAGDVFIKHLIQVRTDTVRASLETASSTNKASSGSSDSITE